MFPNGTNTKVFRVMSKFSKENGYPTIFHDLDTDVLIMHPMY